MKKGFTLAEVLITLEIIGIVAAMTLPALITNAQDKELHNQLLKAYSVIQATINKMNYGEGQIINGKNYPKGKFMPIFKKYFISTNESYRENPTFEDNTWSYISKIYKTYNNNDCNMSRFDDGQVFVNGGMLILVENGGE